MLCGAASLIFAANAAQAAEARDETAVAEIIITGEKVARSLQDTTTSVAVMTAEQIAQRPISNIYDIVARTPGVMVTDGAWGFSIRGIKQTGVGGGGSGQTLSVYVDDAVLASNWATFVGPTDTWDVAQVEILRGPQSTVQGRNSLAGSIVIRTADPTFDWQGKARLETGEYGVFQAAAAVGGPIIDDKLAFRLSANYRTFDGNIDNSVLKKPINPHETKSVRGKLLFEPSDNIRALLTMSYTDNSRGLDLIYRANAFDRLVAFNAQPLEASKTALGSLNVSWDINENLSLTSITAYQRTRYVQFLDLDYSAAPTGTYTRLGWDRDFSQELRLQAKFDRFDGMLGAYYLRSRIPGVNATDYVITFVAPTVPLNNGYYSATDTLAKTYTHAIFGDATYRLTDQLSLLGGFRYDHERQENLSSAIVRILGGLPPEWAYLRAQYESTVVRKPTEAKFNAFLPRLGLKMDWTPDLSTSFVVQKAYRAGGTQLNAITTAIEPFDPETIWNYEASLRSRWMDGRLRVDGNVFYADWKQQQLAVPIDPLLPRTTHTVNAGESKLYGAEAEVRWIPNPNLSLYASMALLHTEFTKFSYVTGGVLRNFAGNEFPYTPSPTYTIGADWSHPSGFFAGADLTARAGVFLDPANTVANKTDSNRVVDLRAGYEHGPYRLTIQGSNVFNEKYFLYQQGAFGTIGQPRLLSVRLDASF